MASHLDHQNCVKDSHDETAHAHRVTVVGGGVEVTDVPPNTIAKSRHVLKDWTNVAANGADKSDVLDVSTALAALIAIEFGLRDASAPPTATTFQIEVSGVDSGDDFWVPLSDYSWSTGTTQAASSAVDGTENAGATVIEEAATGTLAVGDLVFFLNGTLGNSEIARVAAVSANTSFTLLSGLTRAQTGATWYSKAERKGYLVFCDAIKRIRVTMFAGGKNCSWRCVAYTGDSIG